MKYDTPIRRIAVVGTGVIGASWAAQYLARGRMADCASVRGGRRGRRAPATE
jgi:glycine/D-amino acid oxidase-like deaminating enzyme